MMSVCASAIRALSVRLIDVPELHRGRRASGIRKSDSEGNGKKPKGKGGKQLSEEKRTMVYKEQKFDESPPDDFDPAHPYADPVAMIEQREYIVREKLVAIEMAKELRERVKACYRREGVNHYQICRPLVRNYLASIKSVGWGKDAKPTYNIDD